MVKEKKESPEQNPPAETAPDVKDILIAALLKAYSPHETDGKLELKSTFDIIEEMSSLADMESWHVQTALIQNGFQIKYTAAGAFWVMYKI